MVRFRGGGVSMGTARPQQTQVIVVSAVGCHPFRIRLVASVVVVVVAGAASLVVVRLIAFVAEEFCGSD